ncbi:MAG: DJ-1/PfpI family protein [Acidimicrobiia bacterium]|nr:DJ-1/PfpI family protein [Acidimicrobiia bacterium]
MANMVVLLPGGVATREVLGPLEILHERLGLDVIWAGSQRGPVPGHDPPMSFHADIGLTDVDQPPALLLLPGGFGSLEMAFNQMVVDHLRQLFAPPAVYLAVSTGSLPLAAAGLLAGQRVSGHWLSHLYLRRFGAIPVQEQFVTSGRIITCSGALSAEPAARFAADLVAFGPRQDPTTYRRRSLDLGQRS